MTPTRDEGSEFISEDELKTFEGWLRYQGVDSKTTKPEDLEEWRRLFDEAMRRCGAKPKVGRMKFQTVPGEYRYAVAVREDSALWLTLWIRRSRKGEFFVLLPRADSDWDVHASYHRHGELHIKSYGDIRVSSKRQPLDQNFRGTQQIGAFSGHAPKSIAAICEPKDFSGIVEVEAGILGPKHGCVGVAVFEPNSKPEGSPITKVVKEVVFRDVSPWLVVTIGTIGD
jgi:hypothetical protein